MPLVSAAAVLIGTPAVADDTPDGAKADESFTTDVTVSNSIGVTTEGDIIWESGSVVAGQELPIPDQDGVNIDVEGEEGEEFYISLDGDIHNPDGHTVYLELENGDHDTIIPLSSSFGFDDNNSSSDPIALGEDGEKHEWVEFCNQCEDYSTAPENAGVYSNTFTVSVEYAD
ncbi:hypothetical protein CKO14_04915 [Halorhodospira halophila]|nr:hypothetical protein [Halorhodospira halophila]